MPTAVFDANDPGFRVIVDLFVSELPDRVAALERALAENDQETLRRIGHQLKGAAGCYGFDALTQPAAALQLACDQGAAEDEISEAAYRLTNACLAAVALHEPVGSQA